MASGPSHGRQLIYTPTPTAARCLISTALYRLLISPRGEGKSVAALMTLVLHAQKKPRDLGPLKVAVARDTRRNLGLTTVPTWKEWFPAGDASFWTGKEHEPEYCKLVSSDGTTFLEAFFFGCDSTKDLSRFQSFECDAVMIEEPAPAADISGGISGEVLAMAVSSMRHSPYPLVLIAENPPDGYHWTAQIWNLPGAEPPDWDETRQAAVEVIRAESDVFIIPKGENFHLDAKQPGYRQRNKDMLLAVGRGDLMERLVEGHVRSITIGEPVTPEYSSAHEVDQLAARPGDRLLMSWDPEASPSAVLWHPIVGSYCDVLAAWQGVNMGVRQLIERTIKPWMALHLPENYTIIHTGDPNTVTPDKSDSNTSAMRIILSMLGGEQWVPGPVSVDERRVPLHECLNRYHNGRPWIRIDRRHCKILIAALSTGWHYKKDPSGQKISQHWEKNAMSDVGEAFAYGCAFLERKSASVSSIEAWRRKMSQQAKDHRQYGSTRTGA